MKVGDLSLSTELRYSTNTTGADLSCTHCSRSLFPFLKSIFRVEFFDVMTDQHALINDDHQKVEIAFSRFLKNRQNRNSKIVPLKLYFD